LRVGEVWRDDLLYALLESEWPRKVSS
jgi:hypothetical protein